MPKVVINVEVESSGHDVVAALAKAVKDVKIAKAAGGGIPAEIAAALIDAVSVAAEFPVIGADIAESKEEFLKGVMIAAYDLFDAFK
jgi:hypothetical protein